MTDRSLRALRGAAAAGIATFLAAVSHTIGGGPAPSPAVIAAMALLAAPLATAIVGKRPSLWRLTIAVVLSQLAFHTAFSMVGGPSTASEGTAASGLATGIHDHAQIHLPGLAQASAIPMSAPMLVAHAVAAVLSTAILYRGERALRALLALVTDLIAARTRGIAPLEPTITVAAAASALPGAILNLLADAIPRRGPPAASLHP